MPRVKLQIPQNFSFATSITVRITDVNYGGHLGNDTFLSLIHEARVQYLQHHGFTEMQFGSTSLIMSDVAIEFKAEAFYGDVLTIEVSASDFSRAGFDLNYRLVKKNVQEELVVALAKTGMVCFDYSTKKVVAVPEEALNKLT